MPLSPRSSTTAPLSADTFLCVPAKPATTRSTRTRKPTPRRILPLLSALLFAFTAVLAHAQHYKSIVVFGDSLSDTGNVAHLFQATYGIRFPGPIFDYTDGRFTDGADTHPPAEKYFGVWVEQFATMLPSMPAVKNSLDGGTDYAYGFATTGTGTGVFDISPTVAVNIDNIGQQITDYLATHPKIDDKTLFIVWGGAIDVLYATSSADVVNAAVKQAGNVERLVDAGATQFIVPDLPPLGAVPRLNGSPATSIPATQASILFNQTLATGLDIVVDSNHGKHLRVFPMDVFALFNKIIASPSTYGLVNVTSTSRGMPVDPDTYLFWDDLHPTTRGHNIVARTAADLIEDHQCLAEPEHKDRDGWDRDHEGESDCRLVPAGNEADGS